MRNRKKVWIPRIPCGSYRCHLNPCRVTKLPEVMIWVILTVRRFAHCAALVPGNSNIPKLKISLVLQLRNLLGAPYLWEATEQAWLVFCGKATCLGTVEWANSPCTRIQHACAWSHSTASATLCFGRWDTAPFRAAQNIPVPSDWGGCCESDPRKGELEAVDTLTPIEPVWWVKVLA